jgi:cytochrome b
VNLSQCWSANTVVSPNGFPSMDLAMIWNVPENRCSTKERPVHSELLNLLYVVIHLHVSHELHSQYVATP